MSIRQETRVALVGAGYVSAYHIRALQALALRSPDGLLIELMEDRP